MFDIKQEKLINGLNPVSIQNTKNILSQMENCICKIYLKNDEIGTGFFFKFLLMIIYYQF
jgi:hypothetical protein